MPPSATQPKPQVYVSPTLAGASLRQMLNMVRNMRQWYKDMPVGELKDAIFGTSDPKFLPSLRPNIPGYSARLESCTGLGLLTSDLHMAFRNNAKPLLRRVTEFHPELGRLNQHFKTYDRCLELIEDALTARFADAHETESYKRRFGKAVGASLSEAVRGDIERFIEGLESQGVCSPREQKKIRQSLEEVSRLLYRYAESSPGKDATPYTLRVGMAEMMMHHEQAKHLGDYEKSYATLMKALSRPHFIMRLPIGRDGETDERPVIVRNVPMDVSTNIAKPLLMALWALSEVGYRLQGRHSRSRIASITGEGGATAETLDRFYDALEKPLQQRGIGFDRESLIAPMRQAFAAGIAREAQPIARFAQYMQHEVQGVEARQLLAWGGYRLNDNFEPVADAGRQTSARPQHGKSQRG